MKKLPFLLILSIFLSCSLFGQTSVFDGKVPIVPPTHYYLKVSWSHNWLDVKGNPEQVSYFELYAFLGDSLGIYLGSTDKDTITFRPDTTIIVSIDTLFSLSSGFYSIKVRAVDFSGLRSEFHSSLDSTAYYGGWFLVIDNREPEKCSGIRIVR